MITAEMMHAARMEDRESYFARLTALQKAVARLEDVYTLTLTGSRSPAQTVALFIDAVGMDLAAAALATLVNRSAWDGRISTAAAAWAAAVPDALDENAARLRGIYTNRIHAAHLDQLARAFDDLQAAALHVESLTA